MQYPRVIPITFKVTRLELNMIKGLAKLYTKGDRSVFIRMRIFEGQKYGARK